MFWPFNKKKNNVETTVIRQYEVAVAPAQILTNNSVAFKVKCLAGKHPGYSFDLTIIKYPTGNCQVHSIAYANHLFQWTEGVKIEIHNILNACYAELKMIPKLAIVDVNAQWIPKVDECFNVLTKTPYKSTNGSDMCLYLVNLKKE